MILFQVLFFVLLSSPSRAEEKTISASVAAAANTVKDLVPQKVLDMVGKHEETVREKGLPYHLSDLQPVSVSTYPTEYANVLRHYLHFRNRDGNHFLIYEEDTSRPPSKQVSTLKGTMENWNAACTADLECRSKAFCTGNCVNMYYQLSNAAAGKGDADKCWLISYTCFKGGEAARSAEAPAPAK